MSTMANSELTAEQLQVVAKRWLDWKKTRKGGGHDTSGRRYSNPLPDMQSDETFGKLALTLLGTALEMHFFLDAVTIVNPERPDIIVRASTYGGRKMALLHLAYELTMKDNP